MPEIHKEWLHDQENNITVLPYTTLDNIKMEDEPNSGNYTENFKDDYSVLQNRVTTTQTNIGALTRTVSSLGKVIYGNYQPGDTDGKNGDLFIQYNNDKIEKIWHRVNGEWYPFEGGTSGPTISIGNVDVSKKPKINVSITISNYEGSV